MDNFIQSSIEFELFAEYGGSVGLYETSPESIAKLVEVQLKKQLATERTSTYH